jgi:predicted esterase
MISDYNSVCTIYHILTIKSFKVKSLVIKELIENRIPLNRIVLAGFSQGGATSLLSGLTLTRQELEKECEIVTGDALGGIVSLSAYLPIRQYVADHLAVNLKSDIPILMCHGTNDSVVSFEWQSEMQDILQFLIDRLSPP